MSKHEVKGISTYAYTSLYIARSAALAIVDRLFDDDQLPKHGWERTLNKSRTMPRAFLGRSTVRDAPAEFCIDVYHDIGDCSYPTLDGVQLTDTEIIIHDKE